MYAETIFQKLNEFFEKERLDCSKRKSVTTDDAAAMQGSQKGVVKRMKQLSPKCAGIYCILHREALVAKKLKLNAVAVGGKENEFNRCSTGSCRYYKFDSEKCKTTIKDCFRNFVIK